MNECGTCAYITYKDGIGPEVNKEGVAYYNKVINGLLEKGMRYFILGVFAVTSSFASE